MNLLNEKLRAVRQQKSYLKQKRDETSDGKLKIKYAVQIQQLSIEEKELLEQIND